MWQRKRWIRFIGTTVSAAALVTLAACGSGSTAGTDSSSNATVQHRNVSGVGELLVDSSGKTLYFPQEESDDAIKCTDECAAIWLPLTVASDTTPTAASGVTGSLGTVTRPDGKTQVTYDGHPLYTFAEDSEAGDAKGNGITDDFNGDTFTWTAATVSGEAPGSDSSGGMYGY